MLLDVVHMYMVDFVILFILILLFGVFFVIAALGWIWLLGVCVCEIFKSIVLLFC